MHAADLTLGHRSTLSKLYTTFLSPLVDPDVISGVFTDQQQAVVKQHPFRVIIESQAATLLSVRGENLNGPDTR